MNQLAFFYPLAIEWMWNYCIPLGPFVDSEGQQFDLGIYIPSNDKRDVSAAIVHGNTPGDYYSGELKDFGWSNSVHSEIYKETRKRAAYLGLYTGKMYTSEKDRMNREILHNTLWPKRIDLGKSFDKLKDLT